MLDEKIVELNKTSLVASMNGKYSNQVKLSGFILQEPKVSFNPKTNKRAISFIIWQVGTTAEGQNFAKSYSVICYGQDMVDRLKSEIQGVVFIMCYCTLQWQPKMKTLYPQLYDYKITHYVDMELEPPYQKEKKEYGNQENDKL